MSKYHRCSFSSQQDRYNGFQESRVEDTIQSTLGDAVGQVSMNFAIHGDIELFVDKDIKVRWQQDH